MRIASTCFICVACSSALDEKIAVVDNNLRDFLRDYMDEIQEYKKEYEKHQEKNG